MANKKEYCSIVERIKDRYYFIKVSELAFEQIFWCKLEGFKILNDLFEKNYLTAEELQKKSLEVFELNIPFMWHPMVFLRAGRDYREKLEKKYILYDITEALAWEQVQLTDKPLVVTNRIPDEAPEAYILTKDGRSNFFTTTEDGIAEAIEMLTKQKISKVDYQAVLEKVKELFGADVSFNGDKYQPDLN